MSKTNEKKTIHKLFEEQVVKTPSHISVIAGDTSLTYKELNIKANQLAHYLLSEYAIKPEDPISICVDRDENILIAIFAILKMGAAYVSIDCNYPDNKINDIVSDTKTKILITTKKYEEKFQKFVEQLVILDNNITQAQLSSKKITNPQVVVSQNNLAYIIYTSGTSGTSKGVMIEHKGLVNLAQAHSKIFFGHSLEKKNCLNYANYVFDAHAYEIYTTLLNGHTLHIVNDKQRHDINLLSRYIEKNNIYVAAIPPALLNEEKIIPINILVVGGEKTEKKILDNYLCKGTRVINSYGPSEVSVCSTWKEYDGNLAENIGKSIANITCHVLDDNLLPLPINKIGELYLGGIGLARGYLNKESLTSEKFISNPFQSESEKLVSKNAKLYKTGDLVRLLSNGDLEYIGRNDFQIKIRGKRVELGEIEEKIKEFPEVKQCIVIAKTNQIKNKYLIAYYTSKNKINEKKLLIYLRNNLEEQIIPNAFVHLEKFSLNINGKLDRNALPNYELGNDRKYVAPRNQLEATLCKIWAEELGLRLEQISIKDDFFNLGGNSILAIRVISRFNNSTEFSANTLSLFNARTVENFCLALSEIPYQGKLSENISNLEKNKLHHFEEIILRHHLSNPDSPIYNESVVVELSDYVCPDIFKNTIQYILKKYDSLNINYIINDEKITKVINHQSNLIFDVADYKNLPNVERKFNLEIAYLVKRSFDLSKDKLIRFYLFNNIDGKAKILIIFFHSILDGSSITNQIIPQLCHGIKNKNHSSLGTSQKLIAFDRFKKKLDIYYRKEKNEKYEFWKKFLDRHNPISLVPLSTNNTDLNKNSSTGKQKVFKLDSKVKNLIHEVAKKFEISEFSILFSCFNFLLYKLTGQNELAIKTNIDERLFFPENDETIGCFINNIFVESIVDGQSCLLDLILQVQENTLTAIQNSLPYVTLLEINREKSIALSDIHFNLEPVGLQEDNYFQSQIYTHSGNVKNALYFELDIKDDLILGRVEYQLSQYNDNIIQSLIECYINILFNLNHHIEKPIDEIDILDKISKNKIFNIWNDTEKYELNDKNILNLFEEQVERTPHNIALLYENKSLTYEAINQKANRLARHILKTTPVIADELICLYLNRSEYLVISILAVLKVGAAYVPIDPGHPDERAKYILHDTQVKIIITNEIYTDKLENIFGNLSLIVIDNKSVQKKLSCQPADNLNIKHGCLAYVLYTSGTTGTPKGVVLEQSGCVSRINYMIEKNELSENDVVLFKTNYIFDVSFSDIFTTLLSGAKLVITKNIFDVDEIKKHLECSQISICHFVPSQFQAIKDELEFRKYPRLSKLIFSGEKLFRKLFDNLENQDYTILNYYGPTETGEVTLNKFKLTDVIKNAFVASSIGKPFNNIKCHILNEKLNPVPIGVAGELYISGIGVAKGYLNNTALTKERFIANPFHPINESSNNKVIYKTGDLVRWLSNGSIEYLGRNDSQVKIRGYRVELNEIEIKLATYPGIKQCIVLLNKKTSSTEHSNCYLIAYYVANRKLDDEKILAYLSIYLPEYMLPTVICYLEKFPLTTNGKLDKHKLPISQLRPTECDGKPRNEFEAKLINLLTKVLCLTEAVVSIKDDFFKIGGDSILAIRFICDIKKQFDINISVKDLFFYKTIENLYDNVLKKNKKSLAVSIKSETGILSGELDLLPIQKWFFSLKLNHINHWNQSFIIRTSLLNIEKLKLCIEKLVDRHDAFRLRYKNNLGKFKQYYKHDAKYEKVKQLDVSTLDLPENGPEFLEKLEETFTHWQSEFNIEDGPVYRIGYVYGYKDQSARIFFALHHLVIDSISWKILIEDLQTLYDDKTLEQKTSSYRQWVSAVKDYANHHSDEITYWKTLLTDYRCRHNFSHQSIDNHKTSISEIIFTQDNTSLLIKKCSPKYNTQINDLLLTALGLSLSQITKSNVNYILLEGHGREEITEQLDINRTVGWLTTLFPVRLETFENDIGNSIKNIKETLALIPNKGIGFGELVGYQEIDLPKVTFNYLGQFNRPDNFSESDWDIVNESSGKFVSPENENYNVITINGLIIDGHLRFHIQSKLKKNIVDRLNKLFQFYLNNIIEGSSLSKHFQSTFSDFQDFEPSVTFFLNENKPNLFILPPGMGGSESYFNNIVPELKNDFNLVVFNNFYAYLHLTKNISLKELEYVTFEFLASLYITYIKNIQPHGPYNFIGWSFGGVLCYEITRQLIARGEIINNMFLLDPFFNYKVTAKNSIKDEGKLINDINFKYNPPITNFHGINIVFFKSQKTVKLSDLTLETNFNEAKQRLKLINYYAKHLKDNNLKDVVTGANIKIINLKATHINLIETKTKVISSEIRKAFQNLNKRNE